MPIAAAPAIKKDLRRISSIEFESGVPPARGSCESPPLTCGVLEFLSPFTTGLQPERFTLSLQKRSYRSPSIPTGKREGTLSHLDATATPQKAATLAEPVLYCQ